jgi:hypothetical protein
VIQAYRLQLENVCGPLHFIITGDEWFSPGWTGIAAINPEHDLLWIGRPEDKTQRFKTLENFEKEFSSLPRWKATRYTVAEIPTIWDDDDYVVSVLLLLFDCRTGQELDKSVPGRAEEVARLRRGIEQLMRGEHFSFW